MDFPLLTETVDFRKTQFQVRELTADEFNTWAAAMRKDPTMRLLEAARLGTVEPKVTVEWLRTQPAALTITLAEKILDLSDADGKKKPTDPASQTPTTD